MSYQPISNNAEMFIFHPLQPRPNAASAEESRESVRDMHRLYSEGVDPADIKEALRCILQLGSQKLLLEALYTGKALTPANRHHHFTKAIKSNEIEGGIAKILESKGVKLPITKEVVHKTFSKIKENKIFVFSEGVARKKLTSFLKNIFKVRVQDDLAEVLYSNKGIVKSTCARLLAKALEENRIEYAAAKILKAKGVKLPITQKSIYQYFNKPKVAFAAGEPGSVDSFVNPEGLLERFTQNGSFATEAVDTFGSPVILNITDEELNFFKSFIDPEELQERFAQNNSFATEAVDSVEEAEKTSS